MNIKKEIRFRVYVAFTCVFLFGLAIILKAAYIQVKEGPKLRAYADDMRTRTTELPDERGNIYSEDGLLLCSSIPQFDIHLDLTVPDKETFSKNIDTLSSCLANLFRDASAKKYKEDLTKAYNAKQQYYSLKKNLAYHEYQVLRTFPIFNKGKARGGFIAESQTKRINPYGMLAYRTIGLYRENAQTIGLEKTFDTVLNGENGRRMDQKVTGGVWMPVTDSEVEPQNGKDIVTTLDINIQQVAEQALMSVLQQYKCKYGTCIVMEVQTGKIRALANLGQQSDGSYWEDFNYAMIPTEPGSTFKLVTLLSLLNDKYVTIDQKVDAQGGAIRFGNRTMRDSHLGAHEMTIKDAFAHSSNAAFAKLAYMHYARRPDQFSEHLKALHLNQRTGIDLAGERKPLVKTTASKSWSATTLPWMATGYEVLIAPLHTCMVYNAVANNGRMMKPYLISAQREYGKDIKTYEPVVLEESIGDSSTITQAQACLREVPISGTAKHIRSPFYEIAGKTGTAQVADKGIKYTDGVYQGSFVGYFPADKPRYTVAVVIRTQKHSGAYYGGTIAAPVFRMIADKIFASAGAWDKPVDSIAATGKNRLTANLSASGYAYNILLGAMNKRSPLQTTPARMMELNSDSNKKVSFKQKNFYKGIVPDVKGLGLKDAVYLLENEGLRVTLQGRGMVQDQSIVPGTKIIKGQMITIQLGYKG